MSITYPLALPTVTGFSSVKFTGRSVVGVSASPFTGQQQVQAFNGQWWEVEADLPAMPRALSEYWIAFLLSLNGRQGTFLMGDPHGAVARGIATGTPLLNGVHAVRTNSLITDGWTVSQTGILKAGDYIQLGSGSATRLHKVLADVNSDSGGNATFDIWPSTRAEYADNAPLTVSNCKGAFRMAENNPGWSVADALLYGISFNAVEAL